MSGCGDVVVLDSGSTDGTAGAARAAGARVFERRFDNFAGQRNFAHREIPFRHPWVFHLDADERMTPELAAECAEAAGRDDVDGFYAAPRMTFEGRWIPRCTDYPAWQARYARIPAFRFIEVGHGQREAPGLRMGRLRSGYVHDLSSGGGAEWEEKHRRYAAAEAREQVAARTHPVWRELASADPLRRRRALKALSYRLPCRPAIRFLYQYLLRRGFLDGGPGYRYCLLLARYEAFTAAEMHRLRSTQ